MPVGANAAVSGLMVNVGVNLQQFNTGMDQVEQRGAKAAQSLNSIGSALTTGAGIAAGFAVVNTALSAVSGIAESAGSAIIGLNSQLEQARIGFTAFTGSAEKANDFVKQLQQFAATTTFEFPGLLQAARELTGMGVQAELVIPMLKDVGAAVASVGGGDQQIQQVNTALTKMIATGRVNARSMQEMATAGLPAWKMLADSMGLTIGQVRKLSEQGQITADQMLQAFHNFVLNNHLDDVLAKSSQTWQAASSNIIDGLRKIGAEGFEPLFNTIRQFAVELAGALTSDQAEQFAANLKATVQDVMDMMTPLSDAITRAFTAFNTDGFTGALNSIMTDIQNLIGQMGGAGTQLISEFAGGIISGADNLIVEAANYVADIIASYLIGNSPPPVGPLSAIATGGANVIAAYVDGLKSGTAGVADVAQSIVDAFGKVEGSMTLSAGRQALQDAAGDMKALQGAAEDADGVLRGLTQQIQDNQSSLRDYQNAASDIKDAFEGAIEPLQRQVDALKDATDLTQKQADLQDRMQLAQLKGQVAAAQGDPVKRAQLQVQLDTLNSQEQQIALQERAISLQAQSAAIDAKSKGVKVDDTATSQRANQLAQQKLGIQQQENSIQLQLNGMVDKEAVARAKTQEAVVTAKKDQTDLNAQVADLNRQLQAAPLEAQIKGLKEQEAALLQPIQQRITDTQRQGQQLQEERQKWQDIKSAITDVMQQQRTLTTETAKATKDAALAHTFDLSTIYNPQAINDAGAKIGQSWLTGFQGYISEHAASIIGAGLGAVLGGAAFGPLGAVAGGIFGKAFMERMAQSFGSVEAIGGDIAGKLSDALNIDTGKATNSAEAFAIIWEKTRDRIHLAIEAAIIDVASLLNIDVSAGATQGDRVAIIWETMRDRVVVAITDTIAKIAELTGTDISGANTNVEALATIWEDVSTRVIAAITDIQTKVQPVIDGIAAQWQSLVDTWNSAEFKDNISTIAGNISSILQTVAGDLDKTKVNLDSLNNTPVDGQKFLTIGAAVQSATHDIALMTTAIVNLIDLFSTADKITTEFAQNLGSAMRGAGDLVKAAGAFATGDFDAADALFGDKQQMDQDITARGADIQKMWAEMLARIKERTDAVTNAGKSVPDGLAAGITQGQPEVEAAAAGLATGGVSKFAETMQSRSPSQVMVEQGTFMDAGLARGITDGQGVVIAAVADETAGMLAAYATGYSAIHEQTTAQLDEIYALIVEKGTDDVGAVTNTMTDMLSAWAAGMSAIHAQLTSQLDEIYALIAGKATDIVGAFTNMMTQSVGTITAAVPQFQSAGAALGNAIAAGIMSAQSAMQSSVAKLMSTGAGAGGGGAGAVTGGPNAAPGNIQAIINQMAKQYGLSPALFTAQLKQESNFNPNAVGGSGERGVGQIMPATLTSLLQKNGVSMQQYLTDIQTQIQVSASHMADLIAQFGDYDKALQAYNGGPGGVGTAATQHYSDIIHQIAQQITTTNTDLRGGAGMQLNVDQITAGKAAGLTMAEAQAICGPYAAMLFAQATGMNPTLEQAKELASAVGWTQQRGMGGTSNFMNLLGNMGINAVRQAATPANINAALSAGNPIALSTPNHYFVGDSGTAEGGIHVGATGTVMGGQSTMTLQQITALGGGMNDLIVLQGKLDAAGTKTFSDLTHTAGQFGTALASQTTQTTGDVTAVADTGTAANTQIQTSTETLAASIQSGVVPAGLAARDAVGAMAIGIQPLIAAWANGQVSSDQLAQSMIQLASQTGLATEPLAQFAAGNITAQQALQEVVAALAQTDPAFAQIQTAMGGAEQSTAALSDTLLRGLANVTGNVQTSLAQAATSVQPLEDAFASGAITGDQFVASVVQLAATTGLTQAPLRLMQDGVISANTALGQVVDVAGQATPGLLGMSTAFGDLPEPATDAATAFLDWIKSLQAAPDATKAATDATEQIPDAIANLQQPVQDASTDAMSALPDATASALKDTVDAVRNMAGPAGDAAREVGQAIADGIKQTVQAAADDIASAAMDIVNKALEAAKKAADAVKKSVDSKGGGDSKGDSDSKASGGRLNAGVWTLVGERGPELISPSGYVYTAGETAGMLAKSVSSGLATLQKFAKGGQSSLSSSKSKSKKDKNSDSSDSSSTPTTPARVETPKTSNELDLEQKILEVTQQRNKVLADVAPIEEQITVLQAKQKAIADGTVADQIQIATNKNEQSKIDLQILKIQYEDKAGEENLTQLKTDQMDVEYNQANAAKGDLATQLKLNDLNVAKLANNLKIAQIQQYALPTRQALANVEQQIADIQKGSVEDQLKTANLQAQEHITQQQILQIQMQQAPLQAQATALQDDINKKLQGTAEQRAQIQANAQATQEIDVQELQNQQTMLPLQNNIRKVQEQIDSIQKGSLDDQYASLDNDREAAKLRLQEISVQAQLRNVGNGTLSLSQDQVNALQKQLEVIDAQKANLSDQSEIAQLNSTINSTDAQKQLLALQAQEAQQASVNADLDAQKAAIQAQTDLINAQNALSALAEQQKLDDLNNQIAVYQGQIGALQAQNAVLDLQVQNIALANTIRADALAAAQIQLAAQVAQYDSIVNAVQQENDLIDIQVSTITASNAVQAAAYGAQLIQIQAAVDGKQHEIDQLNAQKDLIGGATSLIQTQNTIAAAGLDAQIIQLTSQKATQDAIVVALNAQLGTLNAQKQVYEDIRNLADQIANRPPGATPAPGTGTGTSGPPGTVAATATKDGSPTLYLSRGTGIDGWYTSSGQLMVQGGSANPPAGYKVKYLAAGGAWNAGEVAVLGENGPEIAIAARDMHVFPNEQSGAIARAFGGRSNGSGSGSGSHADTMKNVTVNVEYHRHDGTDYGSASLPQIVRDAVSVALRS